MKTTFISLIALGVAAAMAGPADRALADEPMVLTDAQLDRVTAGNMFLYAIFIQVANGGELSMSFEAEQRAEETGQFLRGFEFDHDSGAYVKTVKGFGFVELGSN